MNFDPATPYNRLPLLPPGTDLETKPVLKMCIEARAQLAALDQAAARIPNPAVLINTIPVMEARASSAIENVVTTSDQIFQAARASSATNHPATREALRYRSAIWKGFEMLTHRPVCTTVAVEVGRVIRDVEIDIRRVPGTRITNPKTGETRYTPPVGESRIRDLLANWERFMHDEESLDPLVRMAVAHYQFEAIHPFTDGNGRTGRVLNILFLCDKGLLGQPILHLSRYIDRTRSDYYRLLLSVTTDSTWDEWLLYILEGIRETAAWTIGKAEALVELQSTVAAEIREKAGGLYSHELVETLFKHPYCRIMDIVDAGLAKRETASIYLKKLRDIGMLEEHAVGRDKLFLNWRMLDLLTD